MSQVKKLYKNKNGNLDTKELVQMIHDGTYDEYTRRHTLPSHKCPPYELIATDQICNYCTQCFDHCKSQIKEYKKHYTVKKKKYLKSDLDDE